MTTQMYIPKNRGSNLVEQVGIENRPAGVTNSPKKESIEGTPSQRTAAALFYVNAKFGRPFPTGLSNTDGRRRKELLPPH